jgi:hypothetical protein
MILDVAGGLLLVFFLGEHSHPLIRLEESGQFHSGLDDIVCGLVAFFAPMIE